MSSKKLSRDGYWLDQGVATIFAWFCNKLQRFEYEIAFVLNTWVLQYNEDGLCCSTHIYQTIKKKDSIFCECRSCIFGILCKDEDYCSHIEDLHCLRDNIDAVIAEIVKDYNGFNNPAWE